MSLGACFSALLVSWISQRFVPECIGGGTIATKICLAVGSPVPVRVGTCRFLLSTLYVGAGNALGIEAPTLHISASIASALHYAAMSICNWLSRCDYVNCGDAPPVAPCFTNEGLPQAVVLGCAAGLSAAFRSPLAAISYAVEEYVDVRQTGTVTALVLFSSASATLVCRIFEPQFGSGAMSINTSSPPGSPVEPSTARSEEQVSGMMAWLLTAMLVGLSMGTVSPLVNMGVLRLRSFCHVERNLTQEVMFAGVAGLLTGLVGCCIYLLTSCDSAWGFGPLGSIFNMRRVCHISDDVGTGQEVWIILVLACGKLIAFAFCFATGGPGGVLMPSLFVGALLGRSIGHAAAGFDSALPHAGTVFGMAALFAANMRLPLTAATVGLEFAMVDSSTYDTRLVWTIPLAAALGTWMSAWWDPLSIHERAMFQDGINPFTLSQQIQVMVHGSDEHRESRPKSESIGEMSRDMGHTTSLGSIFSQTSILSRSSSPNALGHVMGPMRRLLPSTDSGSMSKEIPTASRGFAKATTTGSRALGKDVAPPLSRASMRMIMAAQRRSIFFEYAEPTRSSLLHASFISSPDEVLFATRVRQNQGRFSTMFPGPAVVAPMRSPSGVPFIRSPPTLPTTGGDTSSLEVHATFSNAQSSRASTPRHAAEAEHHARTSFLPELPQKSPRPSNSRPSSRRESKDSHNGTGTPACSLKSGHLLDPPIADRSVCPHTPAPERRHSATMSPTPVELAAQLASGRDRKSVV